MESIEQDQFASIEDNIIYNHIRGKNDIPSEFFRIIGLSKEEGLKIASINNIRYVRLPSETPKEASIKFMRLLLNHIKSKDFIEIQKRFKCKYDMNELIEWSEGSNNLLEFLDKKMREIEKLLKYNSYNRIGFINSDYNPDGYYVPD
jgi:hypothetical protein